MSRTRRYLFAALGTACAALGLLGLVVPGLPTTVFVIAASWLWSRSCPVLDRWLRESSRLGGALRRFEESRAMTARAKAVALGSMWAGIVLGAGVTVDASPWIPAAMIVAGLVGTGVILFHVRTEPSGAGRPAAQAQGR